MNSQFNEYLTSNFSGFSIFFTDGSVNNITASSAFQSEEVCSTFRLPSFASALSAEISAIYQCLNFISNNVQPSRILLVSDSKLAITLLSKPTVEIEARTDILGICNQTRHLHSSGFDIHFLCDTKFQSKFHNYRMVQPKVTDKPWFAKFPRYSGGQITQICRSAFSRVQKGPIG